MTNVGGETWDGPRFGEQGGLLTYGAYLRLPELLDQQRAESDPPAHDELLFITIHQVYELWFQLLLAELSDARDRMLAGESYLPRVRLERCLAIERVLIAQVDVIDTMTPQDFLAFRTKLAPASGFQSAQFREIEFLSGLKDPGYVQRFRGLTPAERDQLTAATGRAVAVGRATSTCCARRASPSRRRRSGSRRCGRSPTTGRRTGRCGTSPRHSSTTTRRGRCGAPGTC